MHTTTKIGVLMMLAATLAGPLYAADARVSGRAAAVQLVQNGCLTLGQAVERVRRQHNGRIVSAETRRSGNREVHLIKVLTDDGRVITERIPGCTIGSRG